MRDRLLLTGADGYVGRRLADALRPDIDVVAVSRNGRSGVACDLLDPRAVSALAGELTPRWIIHAAGNKNVRACETTPHLAYDANVNTMLNVLRAWPEVPVLYISTDYVFAGTEGHYSEASPVAPQTTYGRSKLCAEASGQLLAPHSFTSVRVSALYDESATFVRYLFDELSANRAVDCFVDACYTPTYVDDFARMMARLLAMSDRPSTVHVAGARTSRYAFAREYATAFGFDPNLVRPVKLGRVSPGLAPMYPDLSLATPIARSLGFTPTSHRAALKQMARASTTTRRAA